MAHTAIRPCVADGSDPVRSVERKKAMRAKGERDQLDLRDLLRKTVYKQQPLQLTLASPLHPFL